MKNKINDTLYFNNLSNAIQFLGFKLLKTSFNFENNTCQIIIIGDKEQFIWNFDSHNKARQLLAKIRKARRKHLETKNNVLRIYSGNF